MILELLAPFFLMMIESKDFKSREVGRIGYTVYVCKYGSHKDLLYGAKPINPHKRKVFEQIESEVWYYMGDGTCKPFPMITKFPNFSYYESYRCKEMSKAIDATTDGYSYYYDLATPVYIQGMLEAGKSIEEIRIQIMAARERQ